MNVATVFDKAWPFFIILRHRGTIYVCIRKLMAEGSLSFTKAPITPKEVTLRFSKIFVFVDVLRNGYKKSGIWAKLANAYRWETLVEYSGGEPNTGVAPQLGISDSRKPAWDWVVETAQSTLLWFIVEGWWWCQQSTTAGQANQEMFPFFYWVDLMLIPFFLDLANF